MKGLLEREGTLDTSTYQGNEIWRMCVGNVNVGTDFLQVPHAALQSLCTLGSIYTSV